MKSNIWWQLYALWDWATCRVRCALFGHNWDSERPAGPLGYSPDRCWTCDKTRSEDERHDSDSY